MPGIAGTAGAADSRTVKAAPPAVAEIGPPLRASERTASPERAYGSIRNVIQRGIAYPVLARKMGWEGRVVVAFRILADGSVRDIRVVEGSGHAILDRNAVEAVRSASPFPHPPPAAEIFTPVVYKLD
jgi:protein TonB